MTRRLGGAGIRRGLRGPVGGGAPAPYDFAAHSTPLLHLHLVADHVTVTGAGISAVTDLAGTFTVAQATDADRPAFANPGAAFDISNTEALDLSGGNLTGSSYTLFVDLDIASTGASRFLLDLNGAGGRLTFHLGSTIDSMGFTDTTGRNVAAAVTGRQKLRFVYDGGAPGTGEIFRNGTSLGTVAVGNVAPGVISAARISESSTFASAYCDMTLYRMILYPTASLTAGQAAEIEANL